METTPKNLEDIQFEEALKKYAENYNLKKQKNHYRKNNY
jgi:hypothetical protein